MATEPMVSIGFIAKRTGNAVSLIRYYANEELIPSVRTSGGNRVFPRSVIRRVSFILIAQNLGYSLAQIKNLLSTLPDNRTPTQSDWAQLSRVFNQHIEEKITALNSLKTSLEGCIGCGCLSLERCRLYNTDDKVAAQGSGAQLLDENVQSQFLVSHKK
ncbi:redox-sensitive transcriptional activator SoxR [Alteromonas marina]|uniref:redox-sensitive transcriptional activator SoxR n=1 Tax=unclassified Alteromonas TaxID=2614992 RepID=UPI0012E473BC|nr:redox-sensitive transcriptional activator SoxR [Alteromonas sp. KUL150]GFD75812.1 redox-sensitive transcriptional activator SoxR [Tenacibaculum sp. KUL113]GFD87169.1 redox-sensitive transcriptional activator SoxR [Alteromonas sp. KUL150]